MSTPSYDVDFRQARRLLRKPGSLKIFTVSTIALVALPFVFPSYYVGEVTFILIMCVASIGLMVLTGLTGLVSLGQAAFLGIGAYAHALMLTAGVPLPLSLLFTLLLTGAAGFCIGLPAIRVSGLHLAMVTLAFAIIVEHVIGRWTSVTGGHSGMPVPDPQIFGLSLAGIRAFYFMCLVVLTGVVITVLNLLRSSTGRALIGVRDSEAAAYALGINVARTKLMAFVLSAAISGLAGALLAHQIQFITPESFNLQLSVQIVLMVFIGGLGSIRGSILGAAVIGWLPTFISIAKPMLPDRLASQSGIELAVYGAVLTGFVLFEPLGINGRLVKVRAFLASYPLVRQRNSKRPKAYMLSERYR